MLYNTLLGLIALIFLSGCGAKSVKNEEKETIKRLPVIALMPVDTVLKRSYVASIHAVQNVELRVRLAGYLEDIAVDEGQEVKKGQMLFRLNGTSLKAELAEAKAALLQARADAKGAEVEVGQIRIMVDKDVIANSELDVAKAKHDAALARIEQAKANIADAANRLSYTQIHAPFAGIINRFPLKRGSLVEEGTLLTSISDVTEVYAYFDVSEKEYLEYTRGRLNKARNQASHEVELLLADGSVFSHSGNIETLEGEFEKSTGSIAFRARFPNPHKLLKHGSTGRVRLTNPVENALLVPQKSVFEIQDQNYVFVVGTDNKVAMRNFTPGSRLADQYIVLAGLKAGDRIVYEGIQDLRHGAKIEPHLIPPDSLLAGWP